MDQKELVEIRHHFEKTIENFIEKVKTDVNVIAVIVSGSVAYDQVWKKSDVDMTIIVRDQPLKGNSISIIEDGITFNIYLIPRSAFVRETDRSLGGSIFQSYLAKGKLIYTTEDSFHELMDALQEIGDYDKAISVLYSVNELIYFHTKAEKWLTVRSDTSYAQYFLLKAAESIANIELCIAGIPLSRSSIQKALEINPNMMKYFYQEPMEKRYNENEIIAALKKLENYIDGKLDMIKVPVIEFLSDGQVKTASMIAKHFRSDSHYIIEVLDYLAEKGFIDKVSQAIKLTPKSRLGFEEIGYAYFD